MKKLLLLSLVLFSSAFILSCDKDTANPGANNGGGGTQTPTPTTLEILTYDGKDVFNIGINTPTNLSFVVANPTFNDTTDLHVSITEDPSFNVVFNDCSPLTSLWRQDSCTIEIEMNSSIVSTKPLTITATAGGATTIKTYPVNFKDDAILEASYSFEDEYPINVSSVAKFSLVNYGNKPTGTVSFEITPADSIYSIDNSLFNCNKVFNSKDTCVLRINFTPALGVNTGTLIIKDGGAVNETIPLNFKGFDRPKIEVYENHISVYKGKIPDDQYIMLYNAGSEVINDFKLIGTTTKGFDVSIKEGCDSIALPTDVDRPPVCKVNVSFKTNADTKYGWHLGMVTISYAGITQELPINVEVQPEVLFSDSGSIDGITIKVKQGSSGEIDLKVQHVGSEATPETVPFLVNKQEGYFTLKSNSCADNKITKNIPCVLTYSYDGKDTATPGYKTVELDVTFDGYQIPYSIYINVIP